MNYKAEIHVHDLKDANRILKLQNQQVLSMRIKSIMSVAF